MQILKQMKQATPCPIYIYISAAEDSNQMRLHIDVGVPMDDILVSE